MYEFELLCRTSLRDPMGYPTQSSIITSQIREHERPCKDSEDFTPY